MGNKIFTATIEDLKRLVDANVTNNSNVAIVKENKLSEEFDIATKDSREFLAEISQDFDLSQAVVISAEDMVNEDKVVIKPKKLKK